MNNEPDKWEVEMTVLSNRAVNRIRDLVTLSPMAKVEVLYSHKIVHITDMGTIVGSEVFPAAVSIAIHLSRSEIEPTTATLTVSNGIEPTPANLRELNRLIGEYGAIAQVACADAELTQIGITIHRTEMERRAEFNRREEERLEAILRVQRLQERDRAVREKTKRLEEQRDRAVARVERVNFRLRAINSEQA